MATVQRRTPSRLFHPTEYRLFPSDFPPPVWSNDDTTYDFVVMFKKRSRNRQQDVTFIRQKAILIKKAAVTTHLELINAFTTPCRQQRFSSVSTLCQDEDLDTATTDNNVNFLYFLPKEISLHILSYTNVQDIVNIAKTCRLYRLLAYDNLLWKRFCKTTWCCSDYMLADIAACKQSITSWYNWHSKERLNAAEVLELYQANLWRLIYVAMCSFECTPSINHSYRTLFTRRTAECYPTKRVIRYTCSLGNYTLKGINNASFVEYVAFNINTTKPWHRMEFAAILPLAIYNLRDYGLKLARTPRGQHNGEFFRRRGYYLKTDFNRKVHLTYRYFPTIRFRLYKQDENRVLLLCQDIFVSTGETVDCYTMYQLSQDTNDASSEEAKLETGADAKVECENSGSRAEEMEGEGRSSSDSSIELVNEEESEETSLNTRNTI